jgi:hypothetical protein
VHLLSREGKWVDLLANEVGDFNGSKAVGIKRDGIYILNIKADGPWKIAIE